MSSSWERGDALGGLAGSFEKDGYEYPLAYHHILNRDRVLHFFLDRIGALDRGCAGPEFRCSSSSGDALYEFTNPIGFLRFPMSLLDKARFVRLMLRCFFEAGLGRLARIAAHEELLDSWGGPGVRHALFESLCNIKFGPQLRGKPAAPGWERACMRARGRRHSATSRVRTGPTSSARA